LTFRVFFLAFAVGGLATLACGVARELDQAQEQVHSALTVAVFFQSNVPDDQSRSIAEGLRTQDPAIESMAYLSKEEAYAKASKDPLLSRSLMLLRENPLSAVAELHYSKDAWLTRQDPAQALQQLPGVQDIRWNASRRDALFAFEPWKKRVMKGLWIIAFALLIWTLGGIRFFALTLSEWKKGFLFFIAGILGAASALLAWPLILPGQPYPLLPLLFGSLIGMGSFVENRA
jgi:cell division protein FtsX